MTHALRMPLGAAEEAALKAAGLPRRERVAEIVAAFLDGLPAEGRLEVSMGGLGTQVFFEDWPALAAAVRRAGKAAA